MSVSKRENFCSVPTASAVEATAYEDCGLPNAAVAQTIETRLATVRAKMEELKKDHFSGQSHLPSSSPDGLKAEAGKKALNEWDNWSDWNNWSDYDPGWSNWSNTSWDNWSDWDDSWG